MSYIPHKIVVTLDNGREVLYRVGLPLWRADRNADKLRLLGYKVTVSPEYEVEQETESVKATLEGIYGES